jgi:glycerophosphoryl diester phosphodiesterase
MYRNHLPEVVAHRGASGSAPETTLAAYRLALALDADFLELDVQMSRDGEIVAIHDARVDRTSDGQGAVAELTLGEIRGLDAGSWFNRDHPDRARPEFAGERVPTLQEIIDLTRPTRAGLYVEIKQPELYPAEFEGRVLEVLGRNGFEHRVVVQTFDPRSLAKVRALAPALRTALLADGLEPDPVATTSRLGSRELALDHGLLTREVAGRVRAAGLALTVWTVDAESDLERMIDLGVDRIITNHPERLIRLLDRWRPARAVRPSSEVFP